jgi:hypothetical protein
MSDSRTGRKVVALALACAAWLPLAAYADIEITLKNSFIEKFKNRATIDANFTVVKAHHSPNSPSKDGDLHASGQAPEIGLAAVAEVMNARFEQPALDLIHQSEETGQALQVNGIWRLWCEHGGDVAFKQFASFPPITTTNPPHVFELHPLLKVNDQNVEDSFKPIDGFVYKDAERAFRSYENLKSHITPGTTETTITTTMAGFNYVEFVLQLNEDPTHTIEDGLTVMASVLDLQGELLVRNRRMVFAAGTAPFEKVRALHQGDTVHVVGIPRINLSLLSFRVANRATTPGILDWSLPYEMVVVAAFDDVVEPEDSGTGGPGAPGGGTSPRPQPEDAVIEALTRMLSQRREGELNTGACVFTAGTKVFCAVLTKSECDQIVGDWHAGTTCR